MSKQELRPKSLALALGNASFLVVLATVQPAEAGWIKATFSGKIDNDYGTGASCLGDEYPVGFGNNATCEGANFSWTYLIKDYIDPSPSSPVRTWLQSSAEYYPLFGFGTYQPQTGSTNVGMTGIYNAQFAPLPITDPDIFTINESDGSGFKLRTGRGNFSGISLNYAESVGPSPLKSVTFDGQLSGFSSSNPADANITKFLDGALTGSPYTCIGSCTGSFTSGEGGLSFTWSSVSFESVTPTPAPIPVLGASAFFSFTRKYRRRIKLTR